MSIAYPDYKPVAALGFDHLKSIQTIAYFVRKAGGSAEKLKLIKLVYLADRLSFARRGKPINFDSYFSLPHGPVASSALNGMDHNLSDGAWHALALAENRKDVTIIGEVTEDRLSRADRAILDATWDEFGVMTASQIRNWTHKHCPEYVEVGPAASLPIDLSELLAQVGINDPDNSARDLRTLQKEVGRLGRLRAA
ncbi:Panacea domain-containing protein [Sphingosinicella sp. LHD-64]|uniref:Panacea domain-containing protein n=1 Tax=Sphingosinicella sp. LHD-64 TaxID=3072139 RepID=UPI00280D676E|nr:Panacea domain-containing protein [Sphingosinicella sp. LHD-64]MDQ8758142.1 Panacea domain-containing protein [Sphingosinicella sp. LHD-64]